MRLTRSSALYLILMVALTILSLPSCAPLPKGEYWDGSYVHLDPPRYSFEVPAGWRAATAADYPSLGFNRRVFASLDAAGRSAALQSAETELEGIDTGLLSSQGAWIQVGSEARSSGWYSSSDPLRFGMSEGEKQGLWQRFSATRIERAPPTDKPTLTLESIDVVEYGLNRVLRLRFRSDEVRGSLHWTVLGLFSATDTISLAHVGTPENREEGLDGFEAIATSIRFD
jgi:hypothetical protein